MQEFSPYDGIVDYTSKSMKLDGVVEYKRYPLKNGKLNGLLTSAVYEGESNVSMSLQYNPDFMFIEELKVNGIMGLSSDLYSTANTNNYLSLSERTIDDKKTRIASVNYLLSKESMNQPIFFSYGTNTQMPPLIYFDGMYVQDNGRTRVEILEPEHERVQSLLT